MKSLSITCGNNDNSKQAKKNWALHNKIVQVGKHETHVKCFSRYASVVVEGNRRIVIYTITDALQQKLSRMRCEIKLCVPSG